MEYILPESKCFFLQGQEMHLLVIIDIHFSVSETEQ